MSFFSSFHFSTAPYIRLLHDHPIREKSISSQNFKPSAPFAFRRTYTIYYLQCKIHKFSSLLGRVDVSLTGPRSSQNRTCGFPVSGSSQGWWPIRLCVRTAFFCRTLFHRTSVTVYGNGLSIKYYLVQPPSPWRHYPPALVLCSCPTACIRNTGGIFQLLKDRLHHTKC